MIKFSVIINTYNRADHLKNAIRGVAAVSYDAFEVIVVNGPSEDRTKQVLDEWSGTIKVATCDAANLSKSRNIGIALASGDVVAFIDDDAVPHPGWLESLSTCYSDPKVAGAGGFTIDNTGVHFQARKTLCDRFGNAYFPNDFFDERRLCFPRSPIYPSLLGTNSSFRRSALEEIGGFDEAYAYLLDETDVCLRLIDRGYKVVYEPEAIVYHQFAASHVRTHKKIPITLYHSAASKAYFIDVHGAKLSAKRALEEKSRYEDEILRANRWYHENQEISPEHFVRLNSDLRTGLEDGCHRALQKRALANTDLGHLSQDAMPSAFHPFPGKRGLNIALVSRAYPPAGDAGIARWTSMMAEGLAARGHTIHVISNAAAEPSTTFNNGVWVHRVIEEKTPNVVEIGAYFRIPSGLSGWCYAVYKKVQELKSFGLDVVSFPIWDVEGIMLTEQADIPVVMSLHTSYSLAKPFKREWSERLLFEHFHVNKVIDAENRLLRSVDHILANSKAIVRDLEAASGCAMEGRVVIAPHGTFDPGADEVAKKVAEQQDQSRPLRVSWVGRFEERKGFDLACDAFRRMLDAKLNVEVHLLGDRLAEASVHAISANGSEFLRQSPSVKFHGLVSREDLDRHYLYTDVVVMPSRYESFGLVAIEAMAAGTPVVALAAGGLAEVVEDGVTGYLLPPVQHNGAAIAEIIELLVQDRSLLRSLQSNARSSFEAKYTIQIMVEAAEKAYHKAAGDGYDCAR